jgi:hypothetical protein
MKRKLRRALGEKFVKSSAEKNYMVAIKQQFANEHPLGKGEVVSSILPGSTMKIPPLVRSSKCLHRRPAAARIKQQPPSSVLRRRQQGLLGGIDPGGGAIQALGCATVATKTGHRLNELPNLR